ncbi:MAG TPA: IS1634 family transposase [Terracidiphilus sp.]
MKTVIDYQLVFGYVLPYMPSLVAKKKGNKLYYYVVESARVDGKPRIVHQAYLGTAEKLAEMVRERTAPVPLSASMREFGLPAALWSAAVETGVWDLLCSLWPAPRSGPSLAHYLLLAAIHRICAPGPKTEVADWYSHSILAPLWGLDEERLRSQDFWDAFEEILPADEQDLPLQEDPLDQAQLRLLGLWKQKQVVSHRLLAYDTTNFYTYIASSNERNQLAQRGHNKQGRHNLRQVGLSYVLDGENGLSLCHHVYPGQVADVDEFSTALGRITWMLDQNQMEREGVTLVLDKGSAALANTVALEEARLGWISALPWNQAPAQLRSLPVEQLPLCGTSQPGVRAAAEKMLVHGREYLCVVKYSAPFAGEQLHSLTTSLSRALQALRRLSKELRKPGVHWKREQIVRRIKRWLSAPFLAEIVSYELEENVQGWQLQFDYDSEALARLLKERLGRTVLLTNRLDWTAGQVAAGYGGQQSIERVFRGLKDGDWLGWGPMHHWTDRKIRIHAFYCMLGISLLHFLHKKAQAVWADLSIEQMLEELEQIKQFVLLYPTQGEKGPPRAAYVLSQQTLTQQALVKALGLERLHRSTPRG